MLQNSNKNMNKNLKMMVLSATVLIILFFYTIFKSSSHIQNSTYYVGVVFLVVLFIFAIFARVYKDKIQLFLKKNRNSTLTFEKELQKEQSKTKEDESSMNSTIEMVHSNITFNDVAGISAVKEELEEIVDFLNSPKKYLKFDVKLPKGVLLVGPPGVGKTLMARAVAGEAQVPFFYQSGASFVQIYVGMGAKKVRELFEKAKANAPAIVFIDEIDAIGKERTGMNNDERESTLNELLTQMDGFNGDSGVIVIAATNKIEVLDDALLRAGRFDRRVHLNLPNIEDRKRILQLYLNHVAFDIDINGLAISLAGFSSAAIATLINEAKLNMIKRDDATILEADIELAKNKLEFGKKENKILTNPQREILAIYQASKAYITRQKTTLFQEGFKKEENVYASKSQLLQEIKSYLAGFIGVEVIKDESYAVNKEDLKMANKLALSLVEEYEMANSAKELMDTMKQELREELKANIQTLHKLIELMLENEVIEANEF
jgi:ATP-dependent metalloprotease FtsH